MSLPESAIGAAVHADAEAARAEIRAADIVCPSCRVNIADLPRDHRLTIASCEPYTTQCNHGMLVKLSDTSPMGDAEFETWRAAANVALFDDIMQS